jgi:hypothetical protein
MDIDQLERELIQRFRPEAAVGVDMLVRLDVSSDVHLLLTVRNCRLTIERCSDLPDVTFTFRDLPTAVAIFRGERNAIEAFMRGEFRADGYLMMAFKLMELFGSRSLPPTPND